jgi:hypothetical protein
LGLIYHKQGNLNKACALFTRALAIDEKECGPEDVNVAIVLTNLAAVIYEQGFQKKAQEILQRAVGIAEIIFKNNEDNRRWHLDIDRMRNKLNTYDPWYKKLARHKRVHPILVVKKIAVWIVLMVISTEVTLDLADAFLADAFSFRRGHPFEMFEMVVDNPMTAFAVIIIGSISMLVYLSIFASVAWVMKNILRRICRRHA